MKRSEKKWVAQLAEKKSVSKKGLFAALIFTFFVTIVYVHSYVPAMLSDYGLINKNYTTSDEVVSLVASLTPSSSGGGGSFENKNFEAFLVNQDGDIMTGNLIFESNGTYNIVINPNGSINMTGNLTLFHINASEALISNITIDKICNATTCFTLSDLNATFSIPSKYMTFADWNSTNSSYLTSIPSTYMRFVDWNATNETYVSWIYLNMTNYSYLTSVPSNYMTFADWNSTNASYLTEIGSDYLQYQYWNATNESYVTWARWNITNYSYMTFADWNATNTSYLTTIPSTYMQFSDWNSTNSSYLTSVPNTYMQFSDWNSTNETYMRYDTWNATNYSYQTWDMYNESTNSGGIDNVNLTHSMNGFIENGTLQGYAAANDICNDLFGGHMCTEFEIIEYQHRHTVAIPTADAWISAGGPKYVPASTPVNDCRGWTYGTTPSYLGNYWKSNTTTGGYGAAVNCGTSIPIACCS